MKLTSAIWVATPDIVRDQLAFHDQASSAGVAVVPGLRTSARYGQLIGLFLHLSSLRHRALEPQEIRMYCGGLPQNPKPPLDYAMFFSIEGLINEYDSQTYILNNGQLEEVEPLEEIESVVKFSEPVLNLEAFLDFGRNVPRAVELRR